MIVAAFIRAGGTGGAGSRASSVFHNTDRSGRKTTDIVLKHYFQPGREAFCKALNAAMPEFPTQAKRSPKDGMLEKSRERLLELVATI